MVKQTVCAVAALASLCSIQAGTCNWSVQDRKLDLEVVFQYNETNLDRWRTMFTEASRLLYNATEGRLQLGKVRLYQQCAPRLASADVLIAAGDDVARAHVSGCGNRNFQITLREARHWMNDANNRGHIGLVHELGHYFFGLYDEYIGFRAQNLLSFSFPLLYGNPSPVAAGAGVYCERPVGGTGCLMDAGTTSISDFSKTEFCTSSSHIGIHLGGGTPATGQVNWFYQTDQGFHNSSHCWRMIANKLNYLSASGGPAAVASAMPAGFQNPVFTAMPLQKRFSIVIDTTGSMARDNRLTAAKLAAKSFVYSADLPLTPGQPFTVDFVGVVQFRTTGSEVVTMDTALDEQMAAQAIDDLTPSTAIVPAETSIGQGLSAGLAQFVRLGAPGCVEAMVLITDGEQNIGKTPLDVLPELTQRGVIVYPVFVGEGLVPMQLHDLAHATGGFVFSAANPNRLGAILSDIQAAVFGQATIDRQAGTLAFPNTRTVTVNLPTPAGGILSGFTRFNVAGSGFRVRLIGPDGTIYDNTATGPTVTYHAMGTVQTFTVRDAASAWQIEVTRTTAGTAPFDVTTVAPTVGTRLGVTIPAFDFATDALAEKTVQAVVNQGGPVAGGTVTADLIAPDGSLSSVLLVDNGDIAAGDKVANDGIYSANLNALVQDGSYQLSWKANTAGGYLTADEKHATGPLTPAEAAARWVTTNNFVRTTPPGGAAAQVINQYLKQVSTKGATEGTHCIAGESTFLVTAVWQNVSTRTIANPFARLYAISNGNRFIEQQFLLGESAVVAPGQTMTGLLRVKLASCAAFQFKVDITGTLSNALNPKTARLLQADTVAPAWQFDLAPDTAETSRQ